MCRRKVMLNLITSLMSEASEGCLYPYEQSKKEVGLLKRKKRGRGKGEGGERRGEGQNRGRKKDRGREWGRRRESKLRKKGLENHCDSNTRENHCSAHEGPKVNGKSSLWEMYKDPPPQTPA